MLSLDMLKMIYFAFVYYSHFLVYGMEIYANTYIRNINKLAILNNKILNILPNASQDTNTVELYTKFNTFNTKQYFMEYSTSLPDDIKAITSTVSFVNKLHKILL